MSQIKYEEISSERSEGSNVGYFSLKNDQDEAVVRIMHDSTDDFDLVTTHPVQIGNRYTKVNCIRDPREPIDNCPMCKSGSKVQQRMYVHLIRYDKDESGNIVPVLQVWERSASYARTIKNLIDEYGPLSDCVFKIRRNGKAGDMKTTYAVMYGNPNIYRNELYPKIDGAFNDYHVVGNAVMNKSFDDLAEFVATGEFHKKNDDNSNVSEERPQFQQSTTTVNDAGKTPPWEQASKVERPTRYY